MRVASLTSALLAGKGAAGPGGKETPQPEHDNVEPFAAKMRLRPSSRADVASRVSLRINTPRRLRLKLAAAHLGRSSQALMLSAIDHYLDDVLPLLLAGRCACLEQGRVPARSCAVLAPDHEQAPDHCP